MSVSILSRLLTHFAADLRTRSSGTIDRGERRSQVQVRLFDRFRGGGRKTRGGDGGDPAADLRSAEPEKTIYVISPDCLGPTFGYYSAPRPVEFHGLGRWIHPEIFSPRGYVEVWDEPALVSDAEQRIRDKAREGYRRLALIQMSGIVPDAGRLRRSRANEFLSRLMDRYALIGRRDYPGRRESVTRVIAGREVVFWRNSAGELVAGPGACPHLGALLDKCPVMDGTMYCRWHGLALTQSGDQTWSPYRAYDDGVLLWVGLPTKGEDATDRPTLAARPPLPESVSAVIAKPGICEPQDVIANRLDPWHGSWFHPYAFSHLAVDDAASNDHVLVVDVTFRLSRTWGVPVRAEFTCPDSRTIVMHITEGEGAGSTVETHATQLGLGADGRPRTMVTEATIAYSDRPGFHVARWLSPILRPGIRRTARKLWIDDLAYAERRYELRQRGEFPG